VFPIGSIPIGGRIGLLLVAAVLPLATLSAIYAWLAGDTARSAEMRARYETARVVAGAVESMVEGASRATDVVLGQEGVATDRRRCETHVSSLVRLVETIADATVLYGGRRTCGIARGDAGDLRPVEGGVPAVEARTDAVVAIGVADRPAIRIVRAPGGDAGPVAVVHVGLEPIWRRVATSIAGLGSSRVFILTEAGGVIADPNGVVETAAISAVIAAVADTRDDDLPVIQVDAPGAGFVAIARVGQTSLRIAVTSDGPSVGRSVATQIALITGLPLLFLVAAVGISWAGVDRLVNRWVRQLGRATRSYGDGDLSVRAGSMRHAPDEFRALGASFDDMAARIEARSAELERALSEKDHFVRELHHRVKNNFQMIASLLTLQRREADPAVEAAIREAHDRVQALAAAYRASYADGETGSVPLAALLVDLVERLRESAHLSQRVVVFDALEEGLSLHLDRGIPFALLMTELLVPLFDQVRTDEETIRLTAVRDPARADTINASIETADGTSTSAKPLSDRLARAYAAQLGATVTRHPHRIDILLPRHG
jgi:signal transduction histidine kinase